MMKAAGGTAHPNDHTHGDEDHHRAKNVHQEADLLLMRG